MRGGSFVRFWCILGVILFGFGVLLYFSATRPHMHEMAYDQFLAVMLTALGVLLTALALIVGLLAIFGYQKLSETARDEARKAAVGYLEEFLGGTVDAPRKARVASKRRSAGAARKSIVVTAQDDPSASPSEKKGVARRYPRKEEGDAGDRRGN